MIMDSQNLFSDAQAVTATAISTNVIDLTLGNTGLTTIDIGNGEPIWLFILCTTTTVSAGSTTVVFSLESDSTADLATSATVHWTSSSIAKATLVAGYKVARVRLPIAAYERYLGVRYTVSVANFSAGAFTAALVRDPQAAETLYADRLSFL